MTAAGPSSYGTDGGISWLAVGHRPQRKRRSGRSPAPSPSSTADPSRSALGDAHRRLRPRAVLRPLGVRRPAPALRLRRRGLADGRPARPRRRRDARRSGRTCGSATRSRPATRSCGRRSRRSTTRSSPTTSSSSPGAEEAIFCLSNVLLGPGDHAVVTWPGYQSLYEVGRAAGADVTLHELREDDGWALDVERLIASLRPETRLVVVNAPHNPTGMLPTSAEWARLTGELADRGIHLLADEVYRFLEFDEADRLTAGADAFARGHLARRHVEVVRAGRPPDRLARDPRPRAARPLRGVQGLHDDLLVGAVGDPRADRAAGARRASSRRSRRIVAANLALLDRLLRRPRRPLRVGPAARRLDRLPAPARRRADRRRSPRASSRRKASCSCPARSSGYEGNHFRIGFGREDLPDALAGLERFLEDDLRWPSGSTSSTRRATTSRRR